ncbi:hypothetical protein FN922_15970, partial [Shigella flexneri]|nr:hypothetical protein [Shigella flexneri]
AARLPWFTDKTLSRKPGAVQNDGHYFCGTGGNRPDGLNEPVTSNSVYHHEIIFRFLYSS